MCLLLNSRLAGSGKITISFGGEALNYVKVNLSLVSYAEFIKSQYEDFQKGCTIAAVAR